MGTRDGRLRKPANRFVRFVVRPVLAGLVFASLWSCAWNQGAREQAHRVVFLTEVYSCGRYAGAFLVTGEGHWRYFSAEQWPLKDVKLAETKLPPYASAKLNPTDQEQGDCPPHVSTNWRNSERR